jgi:putative heme iron utilization protein
MTYCAEEWTKENELAIERGLRSEMTENFIEGLKTLFVEHYVDVPEDKYNVIDELANRLDEMEEKLDNEVSKNMEIVEENDLLKRSNVIREACEDLTESQKEKMVSLSNGVDFKDIEDFSDKVQEIKEAYFPVEGESISEDTIVEEGTGEISEEKEPVLEPSIARYSEALSKLKPLG